MNEVNLVTSSADIVFADYGTAPSAPVVASVEDTRVLEVVVL